MLQRQQVWRLCLLVIKNEYAGKTEASCFSRAIPTPRRRDRRRCVKLHVSSFARLPCAALSLCASTSSLRKPGRANGPHELSELPISPRCLRASACVCLLFAACMATAVRDLQRQPAECALGRGLIRRDDRFPAGPRAVAPAVASAHREGRSRAGAKGSGRLVYKSEWLQPA